MTECSSYEYSSVSDRSWRINTLDPLPLRQDNWNVPYTRVPLVPVALNGSLLDNVPVILLLFFFLPYLTEPLSCQYFLGSVPKQTTCTIILISVTAARWTHIKIIGFSKWEVQWYTLEHHCIQGIKCITESGFLLFSSSVLCLGSILTHWLPSRVQDQYQQSICRLHPLSNSSPKELFFPRVSDKIGMILLSWI